MPGSRVEFWREKFEANRRRDEKVRQALVDGGWRVEVVWECEIRDRDNLARRLSDFLNTARSPLPGI